MDSSLDGLICFLLEEIALCGPAGASPADILHFLDDYDAIQQKDIASSLRSEGLIGGDDVLEHRLDRPYQEQVWMWLTRHPEIRVGSNGTGNRLSLAEVEVHNERLRALPGRVNDETSPGSFTRSPYDPDAASTNHSKITERSNSDGSSNIGTVAPGTSIHVFTTEERMWYAAAGHGPDFERVPKLEFACLTIIAAYRERGVVHADLVRLTGQDKRSIPMRTQSLADKGYIKKIPVLIPGSRTSLCVLKKFASKNLWHETIHSALGHDWGNRGEDAKPTKVRRNVYEGLELKIRQLVDIVKDLGIITWNDLKKKLDVSHKKPARTLAESVRRLELLGFLQRVMAVGDVPQPQRKLFKSVKLIKEPTEGEWQLFFQADSEASNAAIIFQQGGNSRDDESGSDIEEGYPVDDTMTVRLQDSDSAVINPTGLEYVPLLWTPDLPLSNVIHDAIQLSGSNGMSLKDIREQVVGCFFHRPVEHQLSRLVELWQASQPLHLRHLAIIRDTTVAGKTVQYVHYTYDTYKSLVASGKATWETVEVLKVEENGENGCNLAIDAVPALDEYGFPILDESSFEGPDNTASLKDCVDVITVKANLLGRLHARGRPKGSRNMGKESFDPAKPRGRPRKHWKPGISGNLSNLSSAKAKAVRNSRAVAITYQRKKAEDELSIFLEKGQEEIRARVSLMLKYGEVLKVNELSTNITPVLDALKVYSTSDPSQAPIPFVSDNSPALGLAEILTLWENLFSTKDKTIPQRTRGRKKALPKPVQSVLGYWPSAVSHSILSEIPTSGIEPPSQKIKRAYKRRVSTKSNAKKKPRGQDSTAARVDSLPLRDVVEARVTLSDAASISLNPRKRNADVQVDPSFQLPPAKRRSRTTAIKRTLPSNPDLSSKSERPVRARKKTAKVLESDQNDKDDKGKAQSSPTRNTEDPLSYLDFPAKLKVTNSQMVVFRSDKLRNMPCFTPDKDEERMPNSLPSFPHTFPVSRQPQSAFAASVSTYTSPCDRKNISPKNDFCISINQSDSTTHEAPQAPQSNSFVPSQRQNTAPIVYKQQNKPDTTPEHRQLTRSGGPSYFEEAGSIELETEQPKSREEIVVSSTLNPIISPGEVDAAKKHNLLEAMAAKTPYISTYSEGGSHAAGHAGAHGNQHPSSVIPTIRSGGLDCLSNDETILERIADSVIGETPDAVERGSNTLDVPSILHEVNISQSEESHKLKTADAPHISDTEVAIQPRSVSFVEHPLPMNDGPNELFKTAVSGIKADGRKIKSKQSIDLKPPTIKKIRPTDGSVAALRKKIALEIIETCGGVFPGDHEIYKPFELIWCSRTKAGGVDRRTAQNVMKALIDTNKIRKLKFTFNNKNDVPVTKSVFTLSSIDPTDVRVTEMQRKMIESGTQQYIPEPIARQCGLNGISSVETSGENKPPPRKKRRKATGKSGPIPIVEDAVQLQNPKPKRMGRPRLLGMTLEERRQKRENELIQRLEEEWRSDYAVDGYKPSRITLDSEVAGRNDFLFWPHAAEVSDLNSQGTITRMIQPKGRLMKLVKTPMSSLVTRLRHGSWQDRLNWLASRSEPIHANQKTRHGTQVLFMEPLGLDSHFDYSSSSESDVSEPMNGNSGDSNKTLTAGSMIRKARMFQRKTLERQLQEIAIEYSMCTPVSMRYQRSARMELQLGLDFRRAAKLDTSSARWNMLSIMDPLQGFHISTGTYSVGFASQYIPPVMKSGNFLKVNKQLQKLGFEATWRHLSHLMNPRHDFHAPSGTFYVEFGANNVLVKPTTPKRYQTLGTKRRKINPGTARGHYLSILNPKHSFHHPTGTFSTDFLGDRQLLANEIHVPSAEVILPNDLEELLSQSRRADGEDDSDSLNPKADPVLDQINRIEKWELTTRDLVNVESENWRFINLHLSKSSEAARKVGKKVQFRADQPQRRKRRQEPAQNSVEKHLSQSLELKRRRVADAEGRPFKRMRFRGQRGGQIITPEIDQRILTAVLVVRTLTGGVEQNIDWVLLSHIFDFRYSERFIHQRWASLLQRFRSTVDKFQVNFQERFLKVYEEGVVPPLDYEKLEEYDWIWLIDWALGALKDQNAKSSVPALPGDKQILMDRFHITGVYETDLDEYYEMGNPSSLPRRYTVLHQDPFAVLHDPTRVAELQLESDLPSIARSWVFANIVTPDKTYDAEFARRKLLSLGEDRVEEAVRDLLLMKIISQQNKGRLVPGRDYDLSEYFLSRLRQTLSVQQLKQALKYKQHLDLEFSLGKGVSYTMEASEHDTMAVLNLLATQRIKLTAVNPPMAPRGFFEAAHVTRNLNKKKFEFDMELTPTERYFPGNPLEPLPPPPSPLARSTQSNIDPNLGARETETRDFVRYPIWRDINLDLVPVMWDLVLAAILSLLIARAGINAEEIEKRIRPSLQLWEIESVMQWCVNAGVGTWMGDRRKGNGQDSVRLGEWWWMALGDDFGPPV